MPWSTGPDFWNAISMLILAVISGLVSISTRLIAGQMFTWLWFISQLFSAVLAGYIAWDMYPYVKDLIPVWCTQTLVVSVAAHFGGKLFALVEKVFYKRTGIDPIN